MPRPKKAIVEYKTSPKAEKGKPDSGNRHVFRFTRSLLKTLNWLHMEQGEERFDEAIQVTVHELSDSFAFVFARLGNIMGSLFLGRGKSSGIYRLSLDNKLPGIQFWGCKTKNIPEAPKRSINWTDMVYEVQSGVLTVFIPKDLWIGSTFQV